jgi:TolB-like protein/DNA-binding winged helix-turn-helix (wHTH) protein/Tfp pilus assembly protein PilF
MSLMEKEMYEFGPFSLDPAERMISRDGVPLSLTPKVFDTLVCLVRNRGRLLTKDELLKEIWPETFVEEVNLAVNISILRRALGETAQDARYIATVAGRGYRFVAAVREISNKEESEPSDVSGRQRPLEAKLGTVSPQDQSNSVEAHTLTRELGRSPKLKGGSAVPALMPALSRFGVRRLVAIGGALLLLAATGGYARFAQRRRTAPRAATVSIAVLPFADLSPGKDQEYFSDGLAEELINYLAKVPSVRVVGRSSSFQFKGRNVDIRLVGRQLAVAHVLEGSVQRDGDRIRIMAELIEVDDGFQLWSATYDRQINDIFSVQDEIARAAAGALQVKLLDASGAALSASARAADAEAYQAYLRGEYFFGRGDSKKDLEEALAYADQATKLDPQYAPAWVLRSDIYNMMAGFGAMANDEGIRKARDDALRAISLDGNLASAFIALGDIQLSYDWDWQAAEASLDKASQLEPGSADVLRYRSLLYECLGRLREAIELQRQAINLDPLRARWYTALGSQLYEAGQYKEAQAELEKALELNPEKEHDHLLRGEILLAQDKPELALSEMTQDPREFWRLQGEALAYHPLGRRQDAETALQRIITTDQDGAAFQIAEVYAFRGERDKAFEWLDRAYRQRDGGLTYVKVDPLLKNLRRDPRYTELLRKMRLSI